MTDTLTHREAVIGPRRRSLSDRLLERLKGSSVGFVHWKSNHHLPESTAGLTDFDLLVRRSDRARFEVVISELGFKRVVSPAWARYPGVEDWLGYDDVAGGLLHLHVHWRLVTGAKHVKELRLPWEELLIEDAAVDPRTGWPVPAAPKQAVVLLVRMWAKLPMSGRLAFTLGVRSPRLIPGSVRDECEWILKDTSPEAIGRVSRSLVPAGDFDAIPVLERFQRTRDFSLLLGLGRRWCRELRRTHARLPQLIALQRSWTWLISRKARYALNRYVRATRCRKTIPAGGVMVAVVGSDGAGKSTVTEALRAWLETKVDCHSIYLGSGDGSVGAVQWLRTVMRRAVGRRGDDGKSQLKWISGGEGTSKAGFLRRCYRLADLHLIWRKSRVLRRARRLCDSGSVVLLDRYPQSQVMRINDGPRLQAGGGFSWAAALERRFFRRCEALGPDLVIRLEVTPHTAWERKPDHLPAVLEAKGKLLASVTFGSVRMVDVDAEKDLPEVLAATKKIVWESL